MSKFTVQAEVLLQAMDGAVLIDSDHKVIKFNPAFTQLTGHRRHNLLKLFDEGSKFFDILWQHDKNDEELFSNCLEKKKVIKLAEHEVVNHEGDNYTVHQTFYPMINDTGDCAGVVITYRNVSDEANLQVRFKDMLSKEIERSQDLEKLVAQRTKELEDTLQKMTQVARIDELTDIYNRRAFHEMADSALSMARRYKRCAAIMMCDLDFFKKINDNFGHPAGDALLKATANALKGVLRTEDILARFGGEEFIIMLTETNLENIHQVASRCLQSIRDIDIAAIIPEKDTPQTMSIGIAAYPECGDDVEGLINNADEALYTAKESGRDQFKLYSK